MNISSIKIKYQTFYKRIFYLYFSRLFINKQVSKKTQFTTYRVNHILANVLII